MAFTAPTVGFLTQCHLPEQRQLEYLKITVDVNSYGIYSPAVPGQVALTFLSSADVSTPGNRTPIICQDCA